MHGDTTAIDDSTMVGKRSDDSIYGTSPEINFDESKVPFDSTSSGSGVNQVYPRTEMERAYQRSSSSSGRGAAASSFLEPFVLPSHGIRTVPVHPVPHTRAFVTSSYSSKGMSHVGGDLRHSFLLEQEPTRAQKYIFAKAEIGEAIERKQEREKRKAKKKDDEARWQIHMAERQRLLAEQESLH
jgi:hypothetical protein